ncbi:MAG: zinc metalloprotease HtpX [Deltaproteobacteria bacterium]|nr:zinc metalloprotease HtpX [Deltaproteobacteria bacterium]
MNYLKTAVLLGLLAGMLVAIGGHLGGKQGALIALIIAGVMNFGAYWFSDKMVLAMYGAKQVTEAEAPELVGMVRDLAVKANLPMPKVYMMETDTPNAFATGRNPEHAVVAATTGIMRLLTREELMGVMAHELSHIKNRDMLISTVAATIAGAISYLSHMAMWFGGGRDNERGGHPAVLILTMILGPIAAFLIQMAISRSREYGADRGGAEIAGNPMYLAEALRKLTYYNQKIPMHNVNESTAHMFIVSPLFGRGGLTSLFTTHPPLEERIKRLEAMVGLVR